MSDSKQLYNSLHLTTSMTELQVQNLISKHSENRIGNKKTTKKVPFEKVKYVLKMKKLKTRQNERNEKKLSRTHSNDDVLEPLNSKKRIEEVKNVENEFDDEDDDSLSYSSCTFCQKLYDCNCNYELYINARKYMKMHGLF